MWIKVSYLDDEKSSIFCLQIITVKIVTNLLKVTLLVLVFNRLVQHNLNMREKESVILQESQSEDGFARLNTNASFVAKQKLQN